MFDSEPEPNLNNRVMYQPRGKVLGGTSSINGMIYMRGNHADYDEWRQRGCEGWDYDSVLPYFRKAEDNQRGSSEFHGSGGPLRVSNQPYEWEIGRLLLNACIEAGIEYNPDFNGARQEGAGYYQTTTKDRRRWSTAAAYLRTARKRPNLVIQTHAHATRVLLENGRAVGVGFRTPRGLETARARGEVIVSGGAYGSPQLLLLSGIGPAEHLQDKGIAVQHDLPGVGSNLHDHFNTYCAWRISRSLSLNVLHHSIPHQLWQARSICCGAAGRCRATGCMSARWYAATQPRTARPADEHLRLEHDRSHARWHHLASVPGIRDQPGASAPGGPRSRCG